jgi:hypothetical protein
MSIESIGRSKGLVYGVLAAFALLVFPAGSYAATGAAAPGSGTLSGFVFAKDMKTPVAGAVVKLRNVTDRRELVSGPTDANGMYTVAAVPEGRYLLGVTSVAGDFNLDYTLLVKDGELGKLSMSLAPGAGGQESGEAAVKKAGFFSSVAGRVLVVAAIGVGLYFLLVPGQESSPIR